MTLEKREGLIKELKTFLEKYHWGTTWLELDNIVECLDRNGWLRDEPEKKEEPRP